MNSNVPWSQKWNPSSNPLALNVFPLICWHFREKELTFQTLLIHLLQWCGFRQLYRRVRCTQRAQTCFYCPPWPGLGSASPPPGKHGDFSFQSCGSRICLHQNPEGAASKSEGPSNLPTLSCMESPRLCFPWFSWNQFSLFLAKENTGYFAHS